MSVIADILLGAGALGAAIYCLVLSRRLQKFTQLESGMGGAIAVLSAQVDDMTRTLGRAQDAARNSASLLESQTERAEAAVQRIEILLATLHDLPQPEPPAADFAPPGPPPSADAPQTEGPAGPGRRVLRRRARRDTIEEELS